ncbi:MAG TPA: aminoacyl-tRNA hydrolase [Blastocatellia bacterium]|nr:aminoacyl-tRNA hydrolase [Blastocatellia bacterium]
MWLIVGLGNPGKQYERTRHNCGFMVIDELARRAGRELRVSECQALTTRATIDGETVMLIKPQTFMNLSGVAVAGLKDKYESQHLLVISDDLALPLGQIRLRGQGGAGGHNGLKSIIAKLGTQQFPRLRMGIAPGHPLTETADFVLSEFPAGERQTLESMITRAADAVTDLLTTGIAEAMSKYNQVSARD